VVVLVDLEINHQLEVVAELVVIGHRALDLVHYREQHKV
jgi:hypothetical protein